MTTKAKAAADVVGQEFVITREFAAPRELVWKACTEAKHLAQWWGPEGFTAPVCEWDAQPGNKIFVLMRSPDGTDFPMGGEFHEVMPPERLVTTTGALDEDGNFLFKFRHTLTLTEGNGKTKLTMHSRVIEATPGADKYIGGFETGMAMSLQRLGEYLAEKTEPLVVERIFEAPVARVWQALTDVDQMRQWYFDLKKFNPKPGFEFGFTVEHKGVEYRHRCKVTEVIPEKRLAYTWRYERHPGLSLVSFDLVADDNKTKLKLTHIGLETFPPTANFARKNFEAGWTQIIGSELKKFVESKEKGKP